MNITWSREDLETVLADENIPITGENLLMLYDIFQRLHDLAGQMTDD